MRQTQANVVKLLEAMIQNERYCANGLEHDAPDVARSMRGSADGMQTAIWLLTNPGYFNSMAAIHFPSENE